MFTVGKKKNKGVVSRMSRRPFQHIYGSEEAQELKKIVPDAHDADVDVLLRRTADYICILELKLTVLRRVSAIYGV